jgi:hypothetical protein
MTPERERIRFDTKFDKLVPLNQIIIKEVTTAVEPEVLGVSRWSNVAFYRIMLWSSGTSAINNIYNMRKEVQRILQTNPLGMFTSGIERALISDIERIETGLPEAQLNQGVATDNKNIARSSIRVNLYFSEVVV